MTLVPLKYVKKRLLFSILGHLFGTTSPSFFVEAAIEPEPELQQHALSFLVLVN
jgi:hypothetical protein